MGWAERANPKSMKNKPGQAPKVKEPNPRVKNIPWEVTLANILPKS